MMMRCPACGKEYSSVGESRPTSCPHCGSPVSESKAWEETRPASPAEDLRDKEKEPKSPGIPVHVYLASRNIESTIYLRESELRAGLPPPAAQVGEPPKGSSPESTPSPAPLSLEGAARYEILGSIGSGGMGEVLLSKDHDIRRPVAMKVVRESHVPAEVLARFVEEAQITGQLEHPGIVPVHELGVRADGRLFFTMKLVQGVDLAHVIEKLRGRDPEASRRWTLNEKTLVFLKVLEAVGFAHSRKVIHRDIKPSNIMVGEHGEVYVMDWGLAKVMRETEDQRPETRDRRSNMGAEEPDAGDGSPVASPQALRTISETVRTVRDDTGAELTMEGQTLGTPIYMAPEQASGDMSNIDFRSDIYSLGATLYEWITLERPVEGTSLEEVLEKVTKGTPVPPRQRRPDLGVPRDLEAIICKAMAREKGDRFASIEAFAQDLRAFLMDEPVTARRPTALEQSLRWLRKHLQKVVPAAAILFVILIAASLISEKERRRLEAETEAEKTKVRLLQGEKERAQLLENLLAEERKKQDEWKLVYDWDFSDGKIDPRWVHERVAEDYGDIRYLSGAPEGDLMIKEGMFFVPFFPYYHFAWWNEELGDNLRLEYDFPKCLSPEEYNHPVIGIGGKAYPIYQLVIHLDHKAVNLERQTDKAYILYQRIELSRELLEQDQYHVVFQKSGQWITAEVNGVPLIRYFDPLPEIAAGHRTFSIICHGDTICLDSLKVFRLRYPQLVSILEPGRTLARRGHFEDARQFFEEMASLYEGQDIGQEAQVMLAVLYEMQTRKEEAVRSYEAQLAAHATGGPFQEFILQRLIQNYCGLGIYSKAWEYAEKMIQVNPKASLPGLLQGLLYKELPRHRDDPAQQTIVLSYLARMPVEVLDVDWLELTTVSGLEAASSLKSLNFKLNSVKDLSPLSHLHNLEVLTCHSNRISDLAPIQNLKNLHRLAISDNQIANLEPIRGLTGLVYLTLSRNPVANIEPIRDLKNLKTLVLELTGVQDLRPLRGLTLKSLHLLESPVKDLSPLQGMPINNLNIASTLVQDLKPLRGMPLERLRMDHSLVTDLAALRGMPLRELDLSFSKVEDVGPLHGMPLESLFFRFSLVSDLSPLKGLPLRELQCGASGVKDLSSLAGLPLETLDCSICPVNDLSPLQGMPIRALSCGQTLVKNLSPLRDTSLQWLDISFCPVQDLHALEGLKLRRLNVSGCPMVNIKPLNGMPLGAFGCKDCPIEDFSPLRSSPLQHVLADETQIEKILQLGVPLRSVNGWELDEYTDLRKKAAGIRSDKLHPRSLALRLEGRDIALIPLELTWAEAVEWCQRQGGRLLIPRDLSDFRKIWTQSKIKGPAWVGLKFDTQRNGWVDAEGQSVSWDWIPNVESIQDKSLLEKLRAGTYFSMTRLESTYAAWLWPGEMKLFFLCEWEPSEVRE